MYPSRISNSAAFLEAQAACRGKVTRTVTSMGIDFVVRHDTLASTPAAERDHSARPMSDHSQFASPRPDEAGGGNKSEGS